MHCVLIAGIRIGFAMTQYSADESDPTVGVVVELLEGDIQGTSVTVMLSTADGTAICTFLFHLSKHYQCKVPF